MDGSVFGSAQIQRFLVSVCDVGRRILVFLLGDVVVFHGGELGEEERVRHGRRKPSQERIGKLQSLRVDHELGYGMLQDVLLLRRVLLLLVLSPRELYPGGASRSSAGAVDVDNRQRIRRAVGVEDDGRLVSVFPEMHLQGMAIFGRVVAICASVLIDVRVRLHVGVEHRFVDARIFALVAFERLGADMVAEVVFQVVLVFGDEGAPGAVEPLLGFDVPLAVLPEVDLGDAHEIALLALERFHFTVRVHLRDS